MQCHAAQRSRLRRVQQSWQWKASELRQVKWGKRTGAGSPLLLRVGSGPVCSQEETEGIILTMKRTWLLICILISFGTGLSAAHGQGSTSAIQLKDDQPATLRFYGSNDADLFTREVQASFDGVLEDNFYPVAREGFP